MMRGKLEKQEQMFALDRFVLIQDERSTSLFVSCQWTCVGSSHHNNKKTHVWDGWLADGWMVHIVFLGRRKEVVVVYE